MPDSTRYGAQNLRFVHNWDGAWVSDRLPITGPAYEGPGVERVACWPVIGGGWIVIRRRVVDAFGDNEVEYKSPRAVSCASFAECLCRWPEVLPATEKIERKVDA